MGIFSADHHSQTPQMPVTAEQDGRGPSADSFLIMCDGCHAARARVEVITGAGSIFLCQHHHKKHRSSIIAAGHQIRGRLGN